MHYNYKVIKQLNNATTQRIDQLIHGLDASAYSTHEQLTNDIDSLINLIQFSLRDELNNKKEGYRFGLITRLLKQLRHNIHDHQNAPAQILSDLQYCTKQLNNHTSNLGWFFESYTETLMKKFIHELRARAVWWVINTHGNDTIPITDQMIQFINDYCQHYISLNNQLTKSIAAWAVSNNQKQVLSKLLTQPRFVSQLTIDYLKQLLAIAGQKGNDCLDTLIERIYFLNINQFNQLEFKPDQTTQAVLGHGLYERSPELFTIPLSLTVLNGHFLAVNKLLDNEPPRISSDWLSRTKLAILNTDSFYSALDDNNGCMVQCLLKLYQSGFHNLIDKRLINVACSQIKRTPHLTIVYALQFDGSTREAWDKSVTAQVLDQFFDTAIKKAILTYLAHETPSIRYIQDNYIEELINEAAQYGYMQLIDNIFNWSNTQLDQKCVNLIVDAFLEARRTEYDKLIDFCKCHANIINLSANLGYRLAYNNLQNPDHLQWLLQHSEPLNPDHVKALARAIIRQHHPSQSLAILLSNTCAIDAYQSNLLLHLAVSINDYYAIPTLLSNSRAYSWNDMKQLALTYYPDDLSSCRTHKARLKTISTFLLFMTYDLQQQARLNILSSSPHAMPDRYHHHFNSLLAYFLAPNHSINRLDLHSNACLMTQEKSPYISDLHQTLDHTISALLDCTSKRTDLIFNFCGLVYSTQLQLEFSNHPLNQANAILDNCINYFEHNMPPTHNGRTLHNLLKEDLIPVLKHHQFKLSLVLHDVPKRTQLTNNLDWFYKLNQQTILSILSLAAQYGETSLIKPFKTCYVQACNASAAGYHAETPLTYQDAIAQQINNALANGHSSLAYHILSEFQFYLGLTPRPELIKLNQDSILTAITNQDRATLEYIGHLIQSPQPNPCYKTTIQSIIASFNQLPDQFILAALRSDAETSQTSFVITQVVLQHLLTSWQDIINDQLSNTASETINNPDNLTRLLCRLKDQYHTHTIGTTMVKQALQLGDSQYAIDLFHYHTELFDHQIPQTIQQALQLQDSIASVKHFLNYLLSQDHLLAKLDNDTAYTCGLFAIQHKANDLLRHILRQPQLTQASAEAEPGSEIKKRPQIVNLAQQAVEHHDYAALSIIFMHAEINQDDIAGLKDHAKRQHNHVALNFYESVIQSPYNHPQHVSTYAQASSAETSGIELRQIRPS